MQSKKVVDSVVENDAGIAGVGVNLLRPLMETKLILISLSSLLVPASYALRLRQGEIPKRRQIQRKKLS